MSSSDVHEVVENQYANWVYPLPVPVEKVVMDMVSGGPAKVRRAHLFYSLPVSRRRVVGISGWRRYLPRI